MPEPNSGCQIWIGNTDDSGYGQIKVNGRVEKTHRIAWSLKNGPIPNGMQVLHKCDTPCCCNEQHLFLGSHDDNMDDMVSKGRARSVYGERNRHAKLTVEQVHEIRSDNRVHQVIADEYGVSQVQISNIKRGVSWRKF